MIKVITYGTFDLLHQGHINILKRAKALGDYLCVGVTTENFDVTRGKINVRQSLMERIEAVKATGIADEVFPEEYVGQKIDDIKRNNIDIFAIGSDWEGKFDYLNEFCKVIYLPRTEGVSSTMLRSDNKICIGTIGSEPSMEKLVAVAQKINGIDMGKVVFDEKYDVVKTLYKDTYNSYDELLKDVDAVYVAVRPEKRYSYVKKALLQNKHVICNSPIALSALQCEELFSIAEERNLQLFDSIKTAYLLSFSRLILLIKGGAIGDIKSIDVTCTSLEYVDWIIKTKYLNSFTDWGAIALLPVIKILGNNYKSINFSTLDIDNIENAFSKINLEYDSAFATVNMGLGVKSEGDLRISGTRGYVYVPAPWWKSEYFEIRYEDSALNKPYYYKSDDEGLSMELVHFLRCIRENEKNFYVDKKITESISRIMELIN